MIGALPEILTINGTDYPIRADYRNILQIFEVFNDPELLPEEKWIVTMYLMFPHFSSPDDVEAALADGFDGEEAIRQINWFISAGKRKDSRKEKPVYSWVYDEQIIFSAVNSVCGHEVRGPQYMHWWTFLSYFNEIGEGTFSFIVGIRQKINTGKKLEKCEREFYVKNRELVDMKPPKTKEEQRQEDEYRSLLDEVIG